nr:rep protein [Cressdnaviricota sp.]
MSFLFLLPGNLINKGMSIEYIKESHYIPVNRMPKVTVGFQLHTTSVILTYSNISKQHGNILPGQSELSYSSPIFDSELPIDVIGERFYNLIRSRDQLRDFPIRHLIICRERHESGEYHYHAGIQFFSQFRTRDNRLFDIDSCHPNIQGARQYFQWVAYCQKDQVFWEYGTIKPSKKTIRVTPKELIELAKTMNKGDFMAYCSVNRYQYAKDIWETTHHKDECTITTIDGIEGTIDPCLHRINQIWDRSKTLILVGKSGIGKTTWCKINLTKPLLMVSHLDDLRRFRSDYHKSILFDDVSIRHLPDTSQIHICDFENPRSIHIRYGCARIPAGIEKAFTCNVIPINIDMPAVKRRCFLVFHQSIE